MLLNKQFNITYVIALGEAGAGNSRSDFADYFTAGQHRVRKVDGRRLSQELLFQIKSNMNFLGFQKLD